MMQREEGSEQIQMHIFAAISRDNLNHRQRDRRGLILILNIQPATKSSRRKSITSTSNNNRSGWSHDEDDPSLVSGEGRRGSK